jgi:hypothetical protein
VLLVQILTLPSIHAVMVGQVSKEEIPVSVSLRKGRLEGLVQIVYFRLLGRVGDFRREQIQIFPVVGEISCRIKCPARL